jgi:hypothetical protein
MVETERKLEDRVEALVCDKHPRLKLTQEDISLMLFRDTFNRPHMSRACRRLVVEKRLFQEGGGVANDPYWYRPRTESPFAGLRL